MKNPLHKIHLSGERVTTWIRDILSGNIFTKEAVRKQWMLIALIVFLIFVYINNGFKTTRQLGETRRLQKEIKEARFTMLDLSADYAKISKPSAIAKQLKEDGSKVTESPKPAILIE